MQKNIKLPYTEAVAELILFDSEDVIATSGGGGDQPPQGNPDGWTGEW